ncbi:hypothetical protein D3C85_1653140 [compost metagenome]
MLTGHPLGQQVLVRHQPGIRPRPGAAHAVDPVFGEILEQKGELADVVGDQDQALIHRPRLQRQQAIHRVLVPWVAAQAPDRFRRVGDHCARPDLTCGLLHTKTAHHCCLSAYIPCL